nr:sensor domain-containing diguanylate cyclase [uncultured Tolumonas sp.]
MNKQILNEKPKPLFTHRMLLIVIIAAWFGLVALAVHFLINEQIGQLHHEFDDEAKSMLTDVQIKLNNNIAVLTGLSAFLQTVEQSDTTLTTKFTESIATSYPYIYMIEVARKVSLTERHHLEQVLQKAWRPNFSIKRFSDVTRRKSVEVESSTETWPVLFMYPDLPQAQSIYGVALESVDFLTYTLASAHKSGKPTASPMFTLYEGGSAYILLQEVNRPSNRLNFSADGPNFFGNSMAAMLVIKTDSLFINQQKPTQEINFKYRANMPVPGKSQNFIFEHKDRVSGLFDRLFLPVFQLDSEIHNPSQPMLLTFSKQMLWSDLLTPTNILLMGLLGFSLVAITWITLRHFQELERSKQQHEYAAYLATHDVLTGLPNRFLFTDRYEQAFNNWQRSNSSFALAMLDLDKFKNINDQYGHDVGDEVLKITATRINHELRPNDTVARYGGDEFVALLTNISDTKDSRLIGERILSAVSEPIPTAVGLLNISCSIGISICPEHGESIDALRKSADQALYSSKQLGRNRVYIYQNDSPDTNLAR